MDVTGDSCSWCAWRRMYALRNVSGDVGGGMGRDYMEKEWGITENKKE